MTEARPGASGSMFSAFRHSTFTVLWAAAVLGNTGTFMRDVASSWLVTGLSPSPTATALIQAAGTLPIFLLAIPAGVLTDILDRRKFLIGIQIYLGAVSIVLLSLAAAGALTIWSLAGLTFLGGIGAALMAPTWQAIVPELVPKADLKGAVALNSLGINISRAIGPAVGGLLLGLSRACVAEFTFYLAIPVMAGASLLKVVKFVVGGSMMTGTEVAVLAVGCVVAFGMSLAAIRFLMDYVKRHDFKFFGAYRIVLGIIVLVWFRQPGLSLVIGTALTLNMLTAAAGGVAVPLALKRMGFDPALAGSVILTTLTDVMGFMSFLGLATLILL